MIRADFHTHTCFSTDSETPVREMIEQAAECGLKTLCITDHWDEDYPKGLEETPGIPFRFDLDAYGKTLEKLRDEYRDKLDSQDWSGNRTSAASRNILQRVRKTVSV